MRRRQIRALSEGRDHIYPLGHTLAWIQRRLWDGRHRLAGDWHSGIFHWLVAMFFSFITARGGADTSCGPCAFAITAGGGAAPVWPRTASKLVVDEALGGAPNAKLLHKELEPLY